MTSSTIRLFEVTRSLSQEEQANIARNLIAANELYNISNSLEYSHDERSQAFSKSASLARGALELMPNNPTALNLVARIELDHAQHDQAEKLLTKALAIVPADENTRLNYAYLLIAKRQYAAAQESFHLVLAANRKSVQAFAGIAQAKLRQKDYFGAFSHYRRLLEMGHDSASVKTYFLESAEFLSCDRYQVDLEALLIEAYSWDNVEHQKLSNLAASLLAKKYDLANESAVIDLQSLTQDQLFLDALSKTLLPSIELENLITSLRCNILEEATLTASLSDNLLPFAIALGQYSARTDYALMLSQDEELRVADLIATIKQQTLSRWTVEDIVGALIVLSMYEPLYTQSFSFQLLREDLEDWPLGVQDLFQTNLYELCKEHQTYIDLYGQSAESLLNNEIRRAGHRWTSVNVLCKSNLYTALTNELGSELIPKRFKTDPLKVLYVGCGSGLRTIYLSQFFENISVYAVDQYRENIAYAKIMVQKLGLYNIHFIHSDYDTALIGEDLFDIIEFGDDLNHVEFPHSVINEWQSLLADDGLMRFSFNTTKVKDTTGVITQLVKERRLSPTADNIRHLRNAIAQEASSGLWDKLFSDERFYTGAGCKELFFNRFNHYFDLKLLNKLLASTSLTFIGFVDLPKDIREKGMPLAPHSLLAWHEMDQDNSLFDSAYQLYCKKI